MNPKVIDISHWQPDPDFAKVKLNGTAGVILKATEGTSYVDPTLKNRAHQALNAGLLIATYHFLRPSNYKAQIDHYLKTVNPVAGERVVLDHEDAGVSLSELKECVEYLLADSRGLQVTIYSGNLIKEQLDNQADLFLAENTSLWIAHYTSQPQPTWPKATWAHWSLWQYSQSESVSGIAGAVDGNRFNGNDEQLRKWWGPAGDSQPIPEPEPQGTEVSLYLAPGSVMKIGDDEWEF